MKNPERYKSAKICCHSVAVTEKCGTLEKFISWYRRSPQTITATSFLTSDTSKTVGRKGNQEKSSTQQRNGGRSKAQRSETVTTVQRADAPPSQPLRHVQANTVSSYGASPLTTLPTRPHSPATTLVHSSGLPDQPPINRRNYPSPSYGSFVIYPLSLCPPQVSTCYGCSAPLKPAGQIAPPPGDLVIVPSMLRSFTQNTMEYRKPSNVYFIVTRNVFRRDNLISLAFYIRFHLRCGTAYRTTIVLILQWIWVCPYSSWRWLGDYNCYLR